MKTGKRGDKMKKYYCDICGKELSDKETIKIVPLGTDFRSFLLISRDSKEIGIETDVCQECLPEFYEIFKKSLEQSKEKATTRRN